MKHAQVDVPVSVIAAGKLRRYHGVPLWKQLLDVPSVAKNIRDVFLIAVGFVQSVWLLRRFRPDVVFAKGGYVCLPVGYAAKLLRIPLVIHDSDTRPGLTNKLLARFATSIATGAPVENYSYPPEKTTYTGVPIDKAFRPFTDKEQVQAKDDIGVVDLAKPLVVVTGGGLGAESINTGMVRIAQALIDDGYSIYHVSGKKHYDKLKHRVPQHPAYHLEAFVYKDMVRVLGAADVVISRASATFLQELAALAKPTIIVPAQHLGDQVKNAAVFEEAQAGTVLTDAEVRVGDTLQEAIESLLRNDKTTAAMVKRFHMFAREHAARDVAEMIIQAGSNHRRQAS